MTPFEKFKASIPDCQCHCRECCQCDRPFYLIKIDPKLKAVDDKIIRECIHIMSINGAVGMIEWGKDG